MYLSRDMFCFSALPSKVGLGEEECFPQGQDCIVLLLERRLSWLLRRAAQMVFLRILGVLLVWGKDGGQP